MRHVDGQKIHHGNGIPHANVRVGMPCELLYAADLILMARSIEGKRIEDEYWKD